MGIFSKGLGYAYRRVLRDYKFFQHTVFHSERRNGAEESHSAYRIAKLFILGSKALAELKNPNYCFIFGISTTNLSYYGPY